MAINKNQIFVTSDPTANKDRVTSLTQPLQYRKYIGQRINCISFAPHRGYSLSKKIKSQQKCDVSQSQCLH